MTPSVPFRAADTTGCTTASVLDRLHETGSPFIFASYTEVCVGFKFSLRDVYGVDVLFEVTRMTDAEEFRKRYPTDPFPSFVPSCYYEAEVRD